MDPDVILTQLSTPGDGKHQLDTNDQSLDDVSTQTYRGDELDHSLPSSLDSLASTLTSTNFDRDGWDSSVVIEGSFDPAPSSVTNLTTAGSYSRLSM